MTDLTPEQIEKWAGDEEATSCYTRALEAAIHYVVEVEPSFYEKAILHAEATRLQQQAENAEQQATIERLEEKGRAFMNAVFLNDGDVVGAGAAFAEVLNDLQDAAKQALQEAGE